MSNPQTRLTLRWHGIDSAGLACSGEQDASSLAELRAQLLRNGIHSLRISRTAPSRKSSGPRIRAADIAALMRQIATLIAAGVALVPALAIVARNGKPRLRDIVLVVRAQIEAGNTFADSLAQHPRVFDELLIAMVAAGERSGTLATLLERIASDREKAERLRRKLLKAVSYPLAVLGIAALVTAGLLRFAVPQFRELFAGLGAELPPFTRAVLGIADGLQAWGGPLALLVLLVILAIRHRTRRSERLRLRLDAWRLRLPVFGPLLRSAAVARYARTLSTLTAAGITLVDALQALAGTSGSAVYAKAIDEVRHQVMAGQSLHLAMQGTQRFPDVAVQMLQIGEESGALEAMSARLADLYEDELDARVDTLASLLEPLLMIILGIIVGGLVLAMYLPIFRLGQAL